MKGEVSSDESDVLWTHFVDADNSAAFYQSWLALQCLTIPGVVGGLLLLGPPDRGPYSPITIWPNVRRDMQHLTSVAEQALMGRTAVLERGIHSDQDNDRVAYPIELRGSLHGVVVVEVEPRSEQQLQKVMRQLHWGSAWAESQLNSELMSDESRTTENLVTILDLVALTLDEDDPKAAAMALVSEVATRLECERVSLGVSHGGQIALEAVSNSAVFGKKMNLLRAIGEAMDEAVDQGRTIVYPEAEQGNAPVVSRAHQVLQHGYGSSWICTIPVKLKDEAAALCMEFPATTQQTTRTIELCEGLAALCSRVLSLKRREARGLTARLKDRLNAWLGDMLGFHYILWKLAGILVVGLVLFASLIPGEYRVTADAVIESSVQQVVVAPFASYVDETFVKAGDLVKQGDLLVLLDDKDISLERIKWLSRKQQVEKEYREAMAEHDRAKTGIISAERRQAEAQLKLLDAQLQRTRLTAPFDGMVVAGDLSQSLGSPVEQGQVLFEVAPLEEYRLVLAVDERDIDEIKPAQQGTAILAALPNDSWSFSVERITPVSNAREGNNTFRVEARLDQAVPRLRPGMEGTGKIHIGDRRLIWIWTHEMVNWLRLKFWTWWP